MEKLKNMINILKSKWLKNTTKTMILVGIIIALFIGINMLVQKLDPKDIDLTKEQLYSLTDESKEKIKLLPETDKINIYMFDYNDRDVIAELAKEYAKVNKNITVELINTEDRPDLVSKYNVESGYYTVIIESGNKSKTLTYYDFYTSDYSTGNNVDLTEQRLTNSIIAVSSVGKTISVYTLTGHGEYSTETEMTFLKQYLELENYQVKAIDLLSAEDVPEDCNTLIIASPKKDFTEPEANAIKRYIQKGGNILWLSDPYSAEEEMPYIKSVLDVYGVNVRQDGIVIEQDKSKMALGSADLVLPSIANSDVTKNVKSVLLLDTGKLEFVDDLSSLNVTKTDLFTTGETSFYRTNIQDPSSTPAEGETVGASIVGAILEKQSVEEGKGNSKLIVIANNLFITDRVINTGSSQVIAIGMRDNLEFALSSVAHLSEVEDELAIRKEMKITQYTATESQDRLIKTIIFALPIFIILLGIVVWQLRRRKK